MDKEKAAFAKRLREALEARGIEASAAVVEKRFNSRYDGAAVTAQAISGWLNGKSIPKQDKLRVLVRTYPQATAGTPGPYTYDTATGAFSYTYAPNPAVTAPTRIFVSPLTTPHGYDVDVTGGHVTSQSGQYVEIAADGTAPVTVQISAR